MARGSAGPKGSRGAAAAAATEASAGAATEASAEQQRENFSRQGGSDDGQGSERGSDGDSANCIESSTDVRALLERVRRLERDMDKLKEDNASAKESLADLKEGQANTNMLLGKLVQLQEAATTRQAPT
ncbi:hypothetical protein HK105_202761, partial [Polyrhizophydium stewartii]